MLGPHPDHEGFPTADELRELLDNIHDWTSAHGEPNAARGVVGFAEDGYPIARSGVGYEASLPVEKLREHVAEHLAALGILDSLDTLKLIAEEPFHSTDGEDEVMPWSQKTVQIAIEYSDPASPYSERVFFIERDNPEDAASRNIPRAIPGTEEPMLDYLGSLEIEATTDSDRITFSEYTALEAITRVWTERWQELSAPGPDRRAVWK